MKDILMISLRTVLVISVIVIVILWGNYGVEQNNEDAAGKDKRLAELEKLVIEAVAKQKLQGENRTADMGEVKKGRLFKTINIDGYSYIISSGCLTPTPKTLRKCVNDVLDERENKGAGK